MTKANKGGSDMLREILKSWNEGKKFQVEDLYREYLSYAGDADEKIGKHTVRYFLSGPGRVEGLCERMLSKKVTSSSGSRRAVGYRVTRPEKPKDDLTAREELEAEAAEIADRQEKGRALLTQRQTEGEEFTRPIPDDTQLPIDNLQLTDPGEVTDSQIGKSMIYYVEELKKRIADIDIEKDDLKEKLAKTIQDLRDTLASTKKELERERLRANNLQIALNRMRNAPRQQGNTKTFNLGEIATIKR